MPEAEQAKAKRERFRRGSQPPARRDPAKAVVSACSTTGRNSCSNAQAWCASPAIGLALVAALCSAASIQTASSIHAGRGAQGLGRTAANRCRRAAVVKPSRSSRRANNELVARGGGPAPCGETPRRQIGIAVGGRRRFEGIGQQFVNGRRAKPQALIKSIHRYCSDQVSQSISAVILSPGSSWQRPSGVPNHHIPSRLGRRRGPISGLERSVKIARFISMNQQPVTLPG